MIIIIDYGVSNLGSVLNMLHRLNIKAKISSNSEEIAQADKIILPGVGSYDNGMMKLAQYGLLSVLHDKVIIEKTKILGICLGMQLFSKRSEEGKIPGFGWIEAETVRFNVKNNSLNLKIPHMGWNTIEIKDRKCALFQGIKDPYKFYFVHSYYVSFLNENIVLATTNHGHSFTSAIQQDNIYGVQFHPEKSHKNGMQILLNFANI